MKDGYMRRIEELFFICTLQEKIYTTRESFIILVNDTRMMMILVNNPCMMMIERVLRDGAKDLGSLFNIKAFVLVYQKKKAFVLIIGLCVP